MNLELVTLCINYMSFDYQLFYSSLIVQVKLLHFSIKIVHGDFVSENVSSLTRFEGLGLIPAFVWIEFGSKPMNLSI